MRKSIRIATPILLQVLFCLVVRAEVKFEIIIDRAVRSEPLTGRVILVITRSDRHLSLKRNHLRRLLLWRSYKETCGC
jgi:hypothetical protein